VVAHLLSLALSKIEALGNCRIGHEQGPCRGLFRLVDRLCITTFASGLTPRSGHDIPLHGAAFKTAPDPSRLRVDEHAQACWKLTWFPPVHGGWLGAGATGVQVASIISMLDFGTRVQFYEAGTTHSGMRDPRMIVFGRRMAGRGTSGAVRVAVLFFVFPFPSAF